MKYWLKDIQVEIGNLSINLKCEKRSYLNKIVYESVSCTRI